MSSNMYKILNKTLINDKKVNMSEMSKLLNSEFSRILSEYSEGAQNSSLYFDIANNGEYIIKFTANVKRFKAVGFFNK